MGPHTLHCKRTSDGDPQAIECTDDGELKIASSLTLDPTNLATSVKQDDIINALSNNGVRQGLSGDSGDPWYVTDPTQVIESAGQAEAVTLGADFSITIGGGVTRGLWVGSTGNVKVDMQSIGTAITFNSVPAGTLLKIRVSKVYSTANGTSASNIVAIY